MPRLLRAAHHRRVGRGCRLQLLRKQHPHRAQAPAGQRSARGRRAAIDVGHNAKLRIDGKASVVGKQAALIAGTNAELEATGTTFEGEVALQVGSNARVNLDRVTMRAKQDAIRAGANLELSAEHAEIVSAEVAIAARSNARVRVGDGSNVRGGQAGIALEGNGEITVANGTVQSDDTAIRMGSNARLSGEGGAIVGTRHALQIVRLREPLALRGTVVEGAQRTGRR